jgi:hypothetical protein
MPKRMAPGYRELVLFYAVTLDMLNELQCGWSPRYTGQPMLQYYYATEAEYEDRWLDIGRKHGWDREHLDPVETKFNYFISPWMRANIILFHARHFHRLATAGGEVSLLPRVRPMIEQVVFVYDTYPEPMMGHQASACGAFLSLVDCIVSTFSSESSTATTAQRELRTALWALHKAAERLGPDEIWRRMQDRFTASLDALLGLIQDVGDGDLLTKTAYIRERMNERRGILSGEVGMD